MAPHSVDDLARSFERHLRAGNKSPRTVETYLEAVNQFAAHSRGKCKAFHYEVGAEGVPRRTACSARVARNAAVSWTTERASADARTVS
jgi:hypothetical protein